MEKRGLPINFDKITKAMYAALYPGSTGSKYFTEKEASAYLEQQIAVLKTMTAPLLESVLLLDIRQFLRDSGDDHDLNLQLLEQFLKSYGDLKQIRLLRGLQ